MIRAVWISTETRELAIAPGARRAAGAHRRAPARRRGRAAPFAAAYLRACPRRGAGRCRPRPCSRSVGRLRLRRRARRAPDRRARLHPDARGARLRARPARWWRRAPRTCRSWSTPCARALARRRPGDRARRCTRSSGSSATSDGRITARAAPARGGTRESVMHFELDRRLEPRRARGSSPAHVRSVLGDVRRAVLDFPAMTDRGAPDGPVRRRRRRALRRRRGRRDRRLPRVAARTTTSSSSATASTGSPTTRSRVVPGSGPRHPRRRGALRVRAAAAAGRAARRRARARARGRPADRLQDEPRSPPCTGARGWTTSACAGSRPTGGSWARPGCSASSRPRPTPSRPPTRRCWTASCARSSATRT